MKSWIIVFFLSVVAALFVPMFINRSDAAQNVRFGNGYYTNLAGGGADLEGNINAYNDEADCRAGEGVCYNKNRHNGQVYEGGRVERYVCSGRMTNCDNTHASGRVLASSSNGNSQSIGSVSCDQTVQLDVFDRNGGLKGFMTWYSGACAQSQTQSQEQTVTTCNNRIITRSRLQEELRGANYPGPWGDINVELAAFNRAACPQATVTPTQSPTPTPTQQPVGGVGNTQSQSQSQTISLALFHQSTPTPTPMPTTTPMPTNRPTVTPTPVPPQVITKGGVAQELPQTGLPAATWAFSGAIPAGFALSFWANRKYKKYF